MMMHATTVSLLFFLCLCKAQNVPSTGCQLKSTPPAAAKCDLAVDVSELSPLTSQKLSSVKECRDLCIRRGHAPKAQHSLCESFWFDNATSTCTIVDGLLSERLTVTRNSNSSKTFFDRSCFRCPRRCPPEPGVNALDNGDFELSQDSIYPWQHELNIRNASKPAEGGAYGNSSYSGRCQGNCVLEQHVFVCPNIVYEISFDFAGTSGEQDPTLTVEHLTLQWQYLKKSSNGTWNPFKQLLTFKTGEVEPTTPLRTSIRLSTLHHLALVLIDNVRIVPTTYGVSPDSPNLLENGDFEGGDSAPWDIYPGDTYAIGGYGGGLATPGLHGSEWCAYVSWPYEYPGQYEGYYYTDVGGYFGYPMDFRNPLLTPGSPYILTFDYRTTNTTTIGLAMYDFKIVANIYQYVIANGTGGGTAQFVFWGVKTGSFSIGVSPTSYSHGDVGGISVDNVSVRELTQPQ